VRLLSSFLLAAADPAQFPAPGPPEVAFLGRSNVGKSSLINSLLGEKIARTSSTPGRTRTINFYGIRRAGKSGAEIYFVDLPGYGYAKLPREITAEWPKFIDPYLTHRRTLSLCVVLVDANVPPQESDLQLAEFLRSVPRDFLVVATKSDRLSNNALRNSIEKLQEQLGVERILPYSVRTGSGREELWREIRTATSALAA
jgi:GTP-binding protein